MWTCPMCGAENADGAVFCKDCGDRYEAPEGEPWTDVQPLGPTGVPLSPAPSEEEPPAVASAPPARGAFLLIFDQEGNVAGEFPLREGRNLIGITSVPDNIFPDVDLEAHDPDQIVSRRHAVITLSGDQYLIEDQRSTNGTWVNGQRLRPHTPHQLLHGDDLVFSQRLRARFTVR